MPATVARIPSDNRHSDGPKSRSPNRSVVPSCLDSTALSYDLSDSFKVSDHDSRQQPSMTKYFTDREYGECPRTIDVIGERVWAGLFTLIDTRIGDGSFGYRFPEQCPDGRGPYGCDGNAFGRVLTAEVPWSNWPLSHVDLPETPAILDILQFCATAVGAPIEQDFHPFFGHSHLSWDRDAGLTRFVNEVNLLFSRNAVAYELTAEGDARRLLPQPLAEALSWTIFATGDVETDRLLESARQGIALPKAEDRQDALEKLWDGFERLKTLEPGSDKRSQADALLDRVAKPGTKFRHFLGEEAMALTKIGNTFRIRHSETSQEALETLEQVDYLFGRLFALVRILLRGLGVGDDNGTHSRRIFKGRTPNRPRNRSGWCMASKSPNIGLRQARALCGMSHDDRLAFLAKGLPSILESAKRYWTAAVQLEEMRREANVLQGHASEEAAKILILMDAARCPRKLISSRMGKIVQWFYDHLARLIYSESVLWQPPDLAELRSWVDLNRRSHVLEGDLGEYVFPNWSLFNRESQLYSDVLRAENGSISWNIPCSLDMLIGEIPLSEPPALQLAKAMADCGLFSHQGLRATSEIWNNTTFSAQENWSDSNPLTQALLERVTQENLPTVSDTDQNSMVILEHWQLPMYDFDFGLIEVSMDELEATQNAIYDRVIDQMMAYDPNVAPDLGRAESGVCRLLAMHHRFYKFPSSPQDVLPIFVTVGASNLPQQSGLDTWSDILAATRETVGIP